MAKIHMETDEVRHLARLMDQRAIEIETKLDVLKNSHGRLSIAWVGGTIQPQFQGGFQQLIGHLEKQTQELQFLSVRLNREVDEWISVDQRFGASLERNRIPGGPRHFPHPRINDPWDGIDLEGGWDFDDSASEWTPTDGWEEGEGGFGPSIKFGVEDELLDAEDLTFQNSTFGIPESYRVDGQLGKYGAGFKANFDLTKGELSAGPYAEWTTAQGSATHTVGSALFGFTTGVTVTALSAEAFAGIKDNDAGFSIGGSLAGIELSQGLNIAGYNIGITAGAKAGLELGVKLGDDSKVKVGPFNIGLHIGKAIV